MNTVTGDNVLRLDKWLWYARFFKTRSAANKVISGGRFRLNGFIMNKPHRQALCGQILTFVQGERVRVIKIVALGSRRGPAGEAVLLYEDLSLPKKVEERAETSKQLEFEARSKGSGRPTKRERRKTDRLKVILNDQNEV